MLDIHPASPNMIVVLGYKAIPSTTLVILNALILQNMHSFIQNMEIKYNYIYTIAYYHVEDY